ncbi:MAG: DUF5668 domain-containing protein [Candidatus Falkowbacteria bacterium]
MLMPWLLIILGAIFLLENLNLIPGLNWSLIWPVLLILAGLYLLKKKGGDDCRAWFAGKKDEIKK